MNEVDEYLKNTHEPYQSMLGSIRNLIKQTIPEIIETISYGMPVFKYKGKYLIGYAAFKDHMSIFPGAEPIEVLEDQLTAYKTSKGTVQFTAQNPITEKIIKDLINVRIKNIDNTK